MEPTPNAQPDASPLEALLAADGLLDALPWGVLVLDEQRVIRRANRQAARWGGISPDALLGQPLAGAGLPPALSAPLLRLLEEPGAAAREAYLPEQRQWITLSAARQPSGWVLFGQDITDLKQSQAEALRLQSELTQRTTDQYHALFHSMDQGFCVLEVLFDDTGQHVVDFRYQQLNPVFSRQSGIPEGAQGKTSRELMPDLEPFWFNTYGRVVLTGESVRLEHYVPQVGRWFDVHVFRVGASEDRQVGVLFHDITARKQAEEQLRLAAATDTFRLHLADALGPLTDPVAMQEAVTRLARLRFEADRCYYVEIEGDEGIIRRDASADGLPSVAGTYPIADFVLLQAVIAAGRPFSVRDVRQDSSVDEGLRQICGQLHIISYLNVPVVKNGQPAGVLCLVQSTPREWTAAEMALAAEVAERTWAAVERARAEQGLAVSEAKYRSLFNSIDEGFVVSELLYDEQGRPTDALMLETNASYDRITHTTGTAGRRAKEVFPASESAWFETYAQVVETGEGLRFENYFAPLDSWIEMYISRVGDTGSRRFATVFNDITARKRHEANLTFLAEISQDLVGLTDIDETMAALSRKIGGYFHVPRVHLAAIDEAAGTAVVTHEWHAEGLADLADQRVHRLGDFVTNEFLRAARAEETIVVGDTRTDVRTDDAAYAPNTIRSFVTTPFVRRGQWLALMSISDNAPRDWREDEIELLRELTTRIWTRLERARAEAALAESELQYRTLFTSIDEGFCTVEVLFDAQGQAADYRFLEANPAFARQTGLASAVGRTMRELVPAHEAFWFDTYGHIARTGVAQRFEHEAAALDSFYDVYAFRIGAPAENRVAILFNDVSVRKRTEKAVRKSEEQFRLFVTASSDVLYRMDAGWQHMLHLDGRNVLADTASPSATWLQAYIPPAEQPAVEAAIQAAIAGPHFFALEHRVVRADGSEGWTSSHAVPVLNARGELVEWFGTATDITARKQAEDALRASEQRQHVLVANLPGAAVFVVDRELRYQLAQGEALREVGHVPADFLGHTVCEMVSPAQWPAIRDLLQQALAGHPFVHEHEQGGRIFLTRGVPLPGPAGQIDAVLAVSYDLTDRKAAEEALRVSEAKYRTLFETMDQGFGVGEVLPAGPGRAADFRWLEVNPQVERLTSMAQAALLSGETMRTVMPQLEDIWYERYERVALTGEPVRFEQHAQVLGRWFDVYAYPLDGPAPHRVALLFTNITARKQAEEALRLAEESHRAELEQRVAARTQELRESRDLLYAIADSQSAYISAFKAVRDEHGRVVDLTYVFVNAVTEQLEGRRPRPGRRLLEVFPELQGSAILESYRRVIETGVRNDQEMFYDDGQLAGWFRNDATPLGDGVLVVGEDITARRQAEQERTRTLHLLEQAEDVAGLGSWDYEVATGLFVWSDGMYRLFGLPPGQPIEPEIYLDYVVDEDRPRAEQFVRQLRTGPQDVEETLRLCVGEAVKTVRIKFVVLRDEQGRPVRTLGVDLDISELHRLGQDNLRLRLTQQQALFEAVQAAQETERRRMAESLHNGIGQMLYATKLRLDRLHAPVLHTEPALVLARDEADQLLGEAIRQTRALSHELVPLVLEDFGLAAALQDIGGKMSTPQLRLRSQVVLDEAATPLAPALQMALYRMAQELAQNIVKHARGATQASLELETTPGWVLLRAEDNGVGFDPHPPQGPGLGLRSIRDRVALLGGQLETGTVLTGGAYVRIRIPLPASLPPLNSSAL